MQLGWLSPEAVAAGLVTGGFEPTACPSLAGGALTMAEVPRIEAANDGGAIGLGPAEGTLTVWRKTAAPGCEWIAAAELEPEGALVLAPGQAGAGAGRSVAASAVATEDGARIEIWALPDAGTGVEPAVLAPTRLLAHSHRRMAAPVFLDDRHLAVASERIVAERDDPREPRILVLDRERPGVYLSIPVDFFAPGRRVEELVAVREAEPAGEAGSPSLIVVARGRLGQVELIRLRVADAAWAAFEATAAEPAGAAEAGVEGRLVSLIPEQVEAERLLEADRLFGVAAGPDVLVYVTGSGPRPSELVRFDLATRERRTLTDDRVRDYLPRVAADGSYSTFVSLQRVNISTTPFSVPRILGLASTP